MPLHLISYCILGILCGVITGLVPGIHVNTIAPIASKFAYGNLSDPLLISTYICSMSLTHTFIDFIPATVLGVPDSDTALSVLPAHKMILEGNGMEAIRLSGIASLSSVAVISVLMPVFLKSFKYIYPLVSSCTLVLLIAFSLTTIFIHRSMKRIMLAMGMFSLSGLFGYIVLNNNFSDPLMPIFTGFFGVSTLLLSFKSNSKIPEQKMEAEISVEMASTFLSSLKGTVCGILVAMVPGIGASQATILSNIMSGGGDDAKRFIICCCSINTANAFFALFTLFLFGKARNGAMVEVKDILGEMAYVEFLILFAAMMITGGIAYLILIKISFPILRRINDVDYYKITFTGLVSLVVIVYLFCGIEGMLLSILATCIGILPPCLGVNRSTLMAFLLVPVIIYYL